MNTQSKRLMNLSITHMVRSGARAESRQPFILRAVY